MIPKSGHRFSEKIMLHEQVERDDDSKKSHRALGWLTQPTSYALDIAGLLCSRSRTARDIRRKKNTGAPTAAKTRNQLDLANSAKMGTA